MGLIKVTGTCKIHVIAVTRIMQCMPILTQYRHSRAGLQPIHTPHFLTDKLLMGVWLHDALAPPTEIHKF